VPDGFAPFTGDDGKSEQKGYAERGENGNHRSCDIHTRTPCSDVAIKCHHLRRIAHARQVNTCRFYMNLLVKISVLPVLFMCGAQSFLVAQTAFPNQGAAK
jgi:hypothetical protein